MPTCIITTPLRLANMHIRMDVNLPTCSDLGNPVPDLKPRRILRPAGVLRDDLTGDFGPVLHPESLDHGDFKRNIGAIAIVDFVDGLVGVRSSIRSMLNFMIRGLFMKETHNRMKLNPILLI